MTNRKSKPEPTTRPQLGVDDRSQPGVRSPRELARVWLNKVNMDGLTAIGINADEGEPGPFIVRGDHSHVEIRKFTITPLVH